MIKWDTRTQGWLTFTVDQHDTPHNNWRIKIIWSSQYIQKKAFDKFQHQFTIKTPSEMDMEGKYLNISKVMYDKSTAGTVVDGEN